MLASLFPASTFTVCLADANNSARKAGEIAGELIIAALLIWGMLASWKSYRNPDVNKACSLAMLILAVAFFLVDVVITAEDQGYVDELIGDLLTGLVLIFSLPASFLIGTFGLVSRLRRDPRLRGFKIGGWAVALSGGCLTLLTIAAVLENTGSFRHAVAAGGELYEREQLLPYESPGLGYRVRTPEGWYRYDELHDKHVSADFGAEFSSGSSYMVVVPAYLGNQQTSLGRIAEALLDGEHSLTPGEDGLTEVRRLAANNRNGLSEIEYHLVDREDGFDTYFRSIIRVKGEFAWMVSAWSSLDEERANADIQLAMRSFELTGVAPSLEAITNLDSRARVGSAVSQLGVFEHERGQLKSALSRFETAVELAPNNDLLLRNLVNTSEVCEGPGRALERLNAHPGIEQPTRELRLIRARLLARTNKPEAAIRAFGQLTQSTLLDDDDLLEMCNCAVDAEQYDETLAALDRAVSARSSPKLLRWRGVMASRAGQHDDAIARLRELCRDRPNDLDALVALIESHEAADQPGDGISLCESYLATHQDEKATLLPLLGRLQTLAEDYATARQTLLEALEVTPNDSESGELLTFVSAQLGRGDNRLIRRTLEEAPLPEALRAIHAALPPEATLRELGEETGLVYLSRIVGYEHRSGEPRRVTERRRVYVANQDGVESVSTLTRGFDPLSERVYVNRLAVFDGDRLVAEGELEAYYVQDESGSGYDSYDQELIAPVPGLKPGVIVDFTVTRESRSDRDQFGFEQEYLVSYHPTLVSAVYVTGDVSGLAHQALGVESMRAGANTLAWIARRPPRATPEAFRPDFDAYLPNVLVADRDNDWAELGAEYLGDLEKTLATDPEVVRLAGELCPSGASPADRVYRLGRHVQKTLTYQAQEFGVRGVIPHRVDRICRAASGDCKDHALLLHHLLRAAGVDSRLALVNTSGRVAEDLPSLDQFDHMVVATPDEGQPDGWRVIDPTNKSIDPLLRTLPGVAERRVLLLDPDDSRLVTIGPVDATQCQAACQRQITVEPTEGAASLQVIEDVTLGPIAAARIRSALSGSSKNDQRDSLWDFLGEGWSGELTRFKLQGLDDLNQPLRLHCEYQLEEAWIAVTDDDSQFTGKLPTAWASLFLEVDRDDDRISPLRVVSPINYRIKNVVIAPPGYRVLPVKKARRQGRSEGLAWRVERQTGEDLKSVTMTARIKRDSGLWKPEAFNRFADQEAKARRRLAGPIAIERASPVIE